MTTQGVGVDAPHDDLRLHLANRHRDEILQFQDALSTSQLIGVAMGIVMAQEGVDRSDALELLELAALRNRRTLRQVAVDVEAAGRLRF